VSVNRVLIVGHGSIGKRHLRLARTLLPHADIRVLRRRGACPVPDGANGCFTELSEALAFGPQVAVIANPAPFHLAAAGPLVRSGAHILVEKPLSSSFEGVAEFLTDARLRGRVVLVGYNLRYLPSLQKFRDLLAQNHVGRVLSVQCEVGQYLPSWRPGIDYRESVSARKELGGGVLLELSHELDYLRWIFGEVDSVAAALGQRSDLEIDVEDHAHLILGMGNRADGPQVIVSVNLDFFRRDPTRMCTVVGERGSLRWNGLTGTVEHFAASGNDWSKVYEYQAGRDETYQAEWKDFLSAVQEGMPVLVSGEDGLAVLRIVDAAFRSAASGCKVLL